VNPGEIKQWSIKKNLVNQHQPRPPLLSKLRTSLLIQPQLTWELMRKRKSERGRKESYISNWIEDEEERRKI
jgi:hypothetical protein